MGRPIVEFQNRNGERYRFYADGLTDGFDLEQLGINGGRNYIPSLIDFCFAAAFEAITGSPETRDATDDMRRMKRAFTQAVFSQFGHPRNHEIIQSVFDRLDSRQPTQ